MPTIQAAQDVVRFMGEGRNGVRKILKSSEQTSANGNFNARSITCRLDLRPAGTARWPLQKKSRNSTSKVLQRRK
jgi:hypothetical protein